LLQRRYTSLRHRLVEAYITEPSAAPRDGIIAIADVGRLEKSTVVR